MSFSKLGLVMAGLGLGLMVGCAKPEAPCPSAEAAVGVKVVYAGTKAGDFSIAGADYFGKIDSITGSLINIQWEAFTGSRMQSAPDFQTEGICSSKFAGNRVRYVGPQGASEFYFPDRTTTYHGTVEAAFPENRFQVKWDATGDTSLTARDRLQF